MPVTFGTVQVIAPASQPAPAASGGDASPSSPAAEAAPPAPRPRELLPVIRHLHDRAARLRAH